MGPRSSWLAAIEDVELMFPKYDEDNEYLIHDANLPLQPQVARYSFDAVIMMSTFLDKMRLHHDDKSWMGQYGFLKKSNSIKVAFSQDDYWFSEVRDDFYCEHELDLLLPVCKEESWSELIPRYLSREKGEVRQGYTTYMTKKMKSLSDLASEWDSRVCDVVYRASGTPTFPNRMGQVKASIGEVFLEKLISIGSDQISTDIRTADGSMIRGIDWHKFVGGSRAILGSNSGSSVNVRNMSQVQKINAYKKNHPSAVISEIENHCFDEKDRNKTYTMLSPRNIEAAMLGTLQILVRGEYSGVLKPYEHYVPLDEGGGNVAEVVEILQDSDRSRSIVQNCRDSILNYKALDADIAIKSVLEFIREKGEVRPNKKTSLDRVVRSHKRKQYLPGMLLKLRLVVLAMVPVYLKKIVREFLKRT